MYGSFKLDWICAHQYFHIFQLNLAASKMSGMDTQQIYFDSVKAFSTKVLITFVRSSALFFIQTFLSSLISKSKDFEFFFDNGERWLCASHISNSTQYTPAYAYVGVIMCINNWWQLKWNIECEQLTKLTYERIVWHTNASDTFNSCKWHNWNLQSHMNETN